ncbi:hypothetical protein [Polyangium spumosum]|uniref:Uncharacterized protein n=1 Tax=Polyangium spumosum TaxID=889282 RepID=A0A6N7PZH1_9BACT|nr:hypothetical protein [Polyangium spumosum]MRG94091.1 hypothetical protein [Polyangium spumosum]
MAKLLLGLGALFLYGSLGVASGIGDVRPEAQRPTLTSAANDTTNLGSREGTASPIPMGGISEDERERRVRECETLHDHCYDWCTRSNLKDRKKLRLCYEDCADKLQDCMKKIPYAD